jgi:hypothetical protein
MSCSDHSKVNGSVGRVDFAVWVRDTLTLVLLKRGIKSIMSLRSGVRVSRFDCFVGVLQPMMEAGVVRMTQDGNPGLNYSENAS